VRYVHTHEAERHVGKRKEAKHFGEICPPPELSPKTNPSFNRNHMKLTKIISVGALIVGGAIIIAQEDPNRRPGGPGGPGGRMMGGPLLEALDTNKDGELDAAEIANASASLKKLDKNGDGKLSADELRPNRPGGPRGPGGPGGPGGAGGRPPQKDQ
jgi:hypothetical protein